MTGQPQCMEEVVSLGREIRDRVARADLDGAGEIAAERQRRLHALFASREPERCDTDLASWLKMILREDAELLESLDDLRHRLELELGSARRKSRMARQYADAGA